MKLLKHTVAAMVVLTLAGGALAADQMLKADVVVVGDNRIELLTSCL